jgi:hypothetical protein
MRWIVPGLIAALAGGQVGGTSESLPGEVASYRSWRPLHGSARPVSSELSGLCRPLTMAERAQVERESAAGRGPHALPLWTRVYVNPSALATIKEARVAFPPGAVLVKEKLARHDSRHPDGVAFMVKRAAGWEFGYRPEPEGADYSGCVQCHRCGAPRDFVFSRLSP